MEFKKCKRCCSFFVSTNDICDNCISKDNLEIAKLKNFFETNNNVSSIEEISYNTGVTIKNLNRFKEHNELSSYKNIWNSLKG